MYTVYFFVAYKYEYASVQYSKLRRHSVMLICMKFNTDKLRQKKTKRWNSARFEMDTFLHKHEFGN